MTNTEIIYNALLKSDTELPKLELEKIKTNCMICGKEITEGAKRNKVVSANFTDYDTFINREGTHICKECTVCIKTRDLRTHNILADKNNIYLFKQKELKEYVFNLEKYVKDEFVIGVTRSFKKHNSFRCSVNYNTKRFYIREEDKEYLFDVNLAKELYKYLLEMYLYFTKDEMLTGEYNINKIKEFGLDAFGKYEAIFKQYRKTHQFVLLVYMLDSEKRNEIVDERIKKQKEEKEKQKKIEKEKKKKEKAREERGKEEIKGQISLI